MGSGFICLVECWKLPEDTVSLPGGNSRIFTHPWQKCLCYCYFSFFHLWSISPSDSTGGSISGWPGQGGGWWVPPGLWGDAHAFLSRVPICLTQNRRNSATGNVFCSWGQGFVLLAWLRDFYLSLLPHLHPSVLPWLLGLLLGCDGDEQPWQLLCTMW